MRSLMKGLPEKIYIGACIALVAVSIINAIDYGVGGKYKDMHSSINWALWIGNTIVLMVLLRRRDEEIEVKDSYIKSLEEYKVLTDEHIVSLKELIESHKNLHRGLVEQIETHKKLHVLNEKIIEEYKNAKPSRF
jgi:hypothetical protein